MTNKTISYRIGKGIVDGSEKVGSAIRKTIEYVKDEPLCFTYPILGNLSETLQNKIRESCPTYNPIVATGVSCAANFVTYPLLLQYAGWSTHDAIAGGLFTAGAETVARLIGMDIKDRHSNSDYLEHAMASLPGKIVSLPLEGILGAYDAIKGRKTEEK